MELVLIRGLPGSGKSTMARAMVGHRHYEADAFFVDPVTFQYHYIPALVKEAHAWCQQEVFKALQAGQNVVVSNTFTQRWEMEPYFNMARSLGIRLVILEAKGTWQNVHGVPEKVIDAMKHRWETISETTSFV